MMKIERLSMVILELYQNDYSKDIVAFDSIKEGKTFVAQIPGYTLETEDGFEVDRSFFRSEDGEAILYRKKGAEDWHFLCYLDPIFLEIEDVEGYVKEEVGEIQ